MSVNQRGGLNLAFISRLRITTILPTATLAHSESSMTTWSKPILVLGKRFAPCGTVLKPQLLLIMCHAYLTPEEDKTAVQDAPS